MPAIAVKLDAEAAAFVNERVAAGDYASADEAVAAAVRLLKENQEEIEEIRALLIKAEEEAERIGFHEDFDFEEFLKRMHTEHAAKCQESGSAGGP